MDVLISVLFLCFVVKCATTNGSCSWCSREFAAAELRHFFEKVYMCNPNTCLEKLNYHDAKTAIPNVRYRKRREQTLSDKSSKMTSLYYSCSEITIICNSYYKYRSFDGSCNNLYNPTWGMTNTAYSRILPPNYRDGIHLPPVASGGNSLPSARILSTAFFPDLNNQDPLGTLAIMQWGQFIAHDVISSVNLGESVNCCDGLNATNENICLPIQIPVHDPFYSNFNISCQNMVRHPTALSSDCNDIGQQINNVSHTIDGSQIYGSTKNVADSLRTFTGGRLLIQTCNSQRIFLPTVDGRTSCGGALGNETSYLAGDTRVNQNPQLTIMHTLFAREHNRIASKLQQMHSNWNDERLYQEARAIVVAELQHITYDEWLPLLVGHNLMFTYNLFPSHRRNFTYNNTIIPVTINSFATSAFRIGHSAIQGRISMCNNYNACPSREINISDWLNRPSIIEQQQNFDDLLRGLINQPMQSLDSGYTQQITQQYLHENNPYGTDLLSTDIQRGRDHGIPSYLNFLGICTGNRPQSFAELNAIIKPEFVVQLESYYKSVEDIDLFIGGNVENVAEGARIGPTFQCIIAEQFYRYKYGDRFWYEIRGQRHSFTNGQLYEIKKATLSRLICDNSDDISNISPKSFLQLSERNDVVGCNQIPSVNLRRWQ